MVDESGPTRCCEHHAEPDHNRTQEVRLWLIHDIAHEPPSAVDADADGDLNVSDAMGQLRHSARILTLAILGIIHSPHEIHGRQAGPYTYEIDDDWTQDISSLAFDVVHDLEQILSAMEAGDKS